MAQEADPVTESPENEAVIEEKKEKHANRGRFLALPFFITEPAIGDGLDGAVMYSVIDNSSSTSRTMIFSPI